uniref:protein CROWDED NUCLEI 3 n=1 Tax=Erigeron canadensis TaxID=72917 RepID=UPI001CB9C3C6|nr:protein CROWDED NUCLEI 3 [Erigeron canadensis]
MEKRLSKKMGKKKVSASESEDSFKEKEDSWNKIFKTLVNLAHNQQHEIEWYEKERKALEKRIQTQHERWCFDVKYLQDYVSQLKRDVKIKDMLRNAEAAKGKLLVSMKLKEAAVRKRRFEDADDERADLKLLLHKLSQSSAAPSRVTRSSDRDSLESARKAERDLREALKAERKLHEALKAERDFAWNQFNTTDKKLQEVIKNRKSEVETANNRVQQLIYELKQSQSSTTEKDRRISALESEVDVLESESRKKSEEIFRLTKELELSRGESRRSITPVLRRCTVEVNKCHSSGMAITEKGVGSSKRKASATTPLLFTSKFKVPKLKN